MKLKVLKDDLVGALSSVAPAVATRSTLPILSNLLLEARGQSLYVTASDLSITVRALLAATVEEEGAITLDAKRLLAIARELPEVEVEITTRSAGSVHLACGAALFRLNGISAEDFPEPPKIANPKTLTIEKKVLRSMLEKTAYATSSDVSREVLTGVYLELQDNRLSVVATDGRRLALVEQEVDGARENLNLVVPSRAVHEIISILEGEGVATISATPKMMVLDAGSVTVMTTLIEGKYPNYRQVIPGKSEIGATLSRELFLNVLRRVSLVMGQRGTSAKVNLSKDGLMVTLSDPDIGEAQEQMPAKYSGREMVISFNPAYLMDPLKYLVSDEITLELTDETSPAVIKGDEPFLYVVMPVRLG